MKLYGVLVTRPDGTCEYLRPASGKEGDVWIGSKVEADEAAEERRRVHGPKGFRYQVTEVLTTES